jgi:phage tail sheath gpL-like
MTSAAKPPLSPTCSTGPHERSEPAHHLRASLVISLQRNRQLYGHCFSARRGDLRTLLTFSETRNSPVMSVMGFEAMSPSPAYEWAAAYCAKAQRGLINDPARPLQTLALKGIKLAPENERFDLGEINVLAHHGIATQLPGDGDQPMISRETTTYQLNLYGFEDDAYELVTTLATLARVLRNHRLEL